MEGVFFRCPPAWEKLLPPGVFGAERAEELAARCWPLLVLTRRGCEELGDTAAMCRVLLAPGDRALSLEHVSAETVVTYGLSHRDSLTLSSLAEPVLCVQRQLPRPGGGVVEPQEFPLPELPAPAFCKDFLSWILPWLPPCVPVRPSLLPSTCVYVPEPRSSGSDPRLRCFRRA